MRACIDACIILPRTSTNTDASKPRHTSNTSPHRNENHPEPPPSLSTTPASLPARPPRPSSWASRSRAKGSMGSVTAPELPPSPIASAASAFLWAASLSLLAAVIVDAITASSVPSMLNIFTCT